MPLIGEPLRTLLALLSPLLLPLVAIFLAFRARAMGLFSSLADLAPAALAPAPQPYTPGDKYPGMVNLSGVLCYMNSVLQAFASLPTLTQHLAKISSLALKVDMPTPVTDALLGTLTALNTGHATRPPALRPHILVASLTALPSVRSLLGGREQQDAHELFVLLADVVSQEADKVAKEIARTRGLGQAAELAVALHRLRGGKMKEKGEATPPLTPATRAPMARPEAALAQPWELLVARRKVCRKCGWSDVVRMESSNGLELPVPRSGYITLDQCIANYLATEQLDGVTCDMCTARATADKYEAKALAAKKVVEGGLAQSPELANLTTLSTKKKTPAASGPVETAAGKKKRLAATRHANSLKRMVEAGVPSIDESSQIKWETIRTPCVREAAIARAPRTLRIHFLRTDYGTMRKMDPAVEFPTFLDLGAYMARGVWESKLPSSMGGALSAAAGGEAPSGDHPRALYKLKSAVLHYGYSVNSGHFVALRAKPQHIMPGMGWLWASDADVREIGPQDLAGVRKEVSMLFYERVDLPPARSERGVETPSEVEEKVEVEAEESMGPSLDTSVTTSVDDSPSTASTVSSDDAAAPARAPPRVVHPPLFPSSRPAAAPRDPFSGPLDELS